MRRVWVQGTAIKRASVMGQGVGRCVAVARECRHHLKKTNSFLALLPAKQEDLSEPEPHYEEFRALRRKIFEWHGERG